MNTSTITKQQASEAFAVVAAVAEAIRELGEVPAGTLYGHLMGKMDFQAFTKVIGIIEGAGLVMRRGDLLVWKGPGKGGF